MHKHVLSYIVVYSWVTGYIWNLDWTLKLLDFLGLLAEPTNWSEIILEQQEKKTFQAFFVNWRNQVFISGQDGPKIVPLNQLWN